MTTRHWRIADGIAWVGDEDRVALIDTRSSAASPMIVPPVFGELWRLLADGPRPESDLLTKGADLVDESAPAVAEEPVQVFEMPEAMPVDEDDTL